MSRKLLFIVMRIVLSAKVTIRCDKQYDAKRRTRNFQMSWLTEFPWLALDADLGIMKCKICCKWANVFDPVKSPLVMGSDKFRKDPPYAQAKSGNHAA